MCNSNRSLIVRSKLNHTKNKTSHYMLMQYMLLFLVLAVKSVWFQILRIYTLLMLRASCLTLELHELRCYEAKIEESEKAGSRWELNQDTSGLGSQCSATELRQPDNHQPSQSSICTAQVELNSLHQQRTHAEWFSHSKCSEHLASRWK